MGDRQGAERKRRIVLMAGKGGGRDWGGVGAEWGAVGRVWGEWRGWGLGGMVGVGWGRVGWGEGGVRDRGGGERGRMLSFC